jgi:archaellum biogenesis ATPase FlaH
MTRPEDDEPGDEEYLREGEDFGDEITPARSTPLADAMLTYFGELERGDPPIKWPVGEGWGTLALRPNRVITIGGPGNVGKTPVLLNLAWQAMENTPTLRILVANNESTVAEIMDLLTAMLGGINLEHVQNRDQKHCTPEKLDLAKAALQGVADRLEFVEMPFTLEQVIERASRFKADVVILDTLQKLRLAGYDGEAGDRVGRMMPLLRDLALQGRCVLAAAQISRDGVRHVQQRAGSRTHDDRDMNVFLHNSEIESASNDAFLLAYDQSARVYQDVDEQYTPIPMWLQHVKGRGNMKAHIPLLFDGRYQKFTLRQVGGSKGTGRGGGGTAPASPPQRPQPRQNMENQLPEEEGAGDDTDWLT